jgi:hypothetical protein
VHTKRLPKLQIRLTAASIIKTVYLSCDYDGPYNFTCEGTPNILVVQQHSQYQTPCSQPCIKVTQSHLGKPEPD